MWCYYRKARRATWYFLVQAVGGLDECSAYTLNMVVLKGGHAGGGVLRLHPQHGRTLRWACRWRSAPPTHSTWSYSKVGTQVEECDAYTLKMVVLKGGHASRGTRCSFLGSIVVFLGGRVLRSFVGCSSLFLLEVLNLLLLASLFLDGITFGGHWEIIWG